MQLIRYEIRKLTSKRNLLVAILLLLFATFTFLYMEQLQSDDVMAKHKDVYFSINKQVNGKNLQDKKAWVEKKYTFYTQVKQYEEQRHLSEAFHNDMEAQKNDAEFLLEYQKFLQSDCYTNFNAYLQIYQYLHTYYNRITEYESYLDGILEKTDFLKNNPMHITMSDEKLQELDFTKNTYERLRNTSFSDEGFLVFDRYVTGSVSVMICFAWLFISIIILQSDESADMTSLITTTKYGRVASRFSKCIVIFITGILLTLLIEGGYLLLLQGLYGGINWEASIQSIPSLYTSAFQGSVGLWYGITFAIKIITGFTLAMIFAFLYQCFQKFSILFMSALLAISYLLVQTISVNSILRIFHYLNLYEISNTHTFFQDYIVFTFRSITISLAELLCICIIICMFLFTALFLFLHNKVRIPKWNAHSIVIVQHTNLLVHEIQKIIANNKFFIICVLLCVYQGYHVYTIAGQRQDSVIEDKVIELYKEYGGVLNPAKKRNIEKQYKLYEKQEAELTRLAAEKDRGMTASEADYQVLLKKSMDQIKDKTAFKIFYKDYLESEVLVYKKGYQAIFAMNTQERDIQMSILLIASLVFALHGIYTFDQQKKEYILYETTKKGRRSRNRAKYIVVLMVSILMYLFYNLSDGLAFYKIYPMFQWDAPLQAVVPNDWSIASSLPLGISCLQYACLLYVIRCSGVVLSGCIITLISRKCENLLVSCFLSLFILLFPMILYYNGADFILYVTIFDLVQGNLFLYHNFNFSKYLAIILFLAGSSVRRCPWRHSKRKL